MSKLNILNIGGDVFMERQWMKYFLPMFKFHFIILLSFLAVAKIGVTHADDWLANPHPIASQNNLLKYKCSMGRGITGTPIAIHPVGSMPNCAYMCRRHLQCRSATFWGNQTCHLHSKTSAQGTFYTNQAIVIDFLEQDSTHILITADAHMMEFIPEVKTVKYLNTTLSIPRRQHVAVLFDGHIILDGGREPGPGAIPVESTVTLSGVPIVQEQATTISYKHAYGCGGLANDKLYHCFGQDGTNTLSHCDIYDLSVGNGYAHSSFDTGLPARYGITCLFNNNHMYVIGGKIPLVAGYTNGVYKIDLSTKNVTPLKNLPFGLGYPSAVWYKGKIVLCGGRKADLVESNLCYKYILTTDNWGTFPSMKVMRYTHALVNWGRDKILAVGGNDGLQGLSSIEVYEGGVWSMFAEMPQAFRAMQVTNLDY